MLKPRCSHDLPDQVVEFRAMILEWFRSEGRDYPWRRTRDPYAILVSEVMLQQTRLAVVLGKGYYQRFMDAFPSVNDLAQAGEQELLRVWEGLGYYRRARMLQSTAIAVSEHNKGRFPEDENELLQLPGVGRYTAAALRSFAYDLPSPLVDGNVMRVLSRLYDDSTPIDSSAGIRLAWERAADLLDRDHPRLYNSALMELGQRVCKVGVPDCIHCPVSSFCRSRQPELLPVKAKRTEVSELTEHAVWVCDNDGRLLLHREAGSRRKGLWRLPQRADSMVASRDVLLEMTYGITRYRVRLMIHEGRGIEPEEGDEWVAMQTLESYPMAAPYRKALRSLLDR
jgi:A/G-specific adenine glycosylase